MMSGEGRIADSIIDMQGSVADAQAEIAELQAMIGGSEGR